MNTLHEIATRDYTEHYARMNPGGLAADQVAKRTYRNMEAMYGALVDRLAPGQAVLDVGCGAGFLLHWLSERPALRLWGVDACEGQAEHARLSAPRAKIVAQDAIDFVERQPSSFGGVFCIDMLEHMQTEEDCFRLLQGIHDSLETGGFLICRVPNAAHILGSFSRYIDVTHHRIFTSHSLRQAFAAAGFKDIRMIPHHSSSWMGKVRLGIEYLFHRLLFLFAGYAKADIYTQNVVAVGFKR